MKVRSNIGLGVASNVDTSRGVNTSISIVAGVKFVRVLVSSLVSILIRYNKYKGMQVVCNS